MCIMYLSLYSTFKVSNKFTIIVRQTDAGQKKSNPLVPTMLRRWHKSAITISLSPYTIPTHFQQNLTNYYWVRAPEESFAYMIIITKWYYTPIIKQIATGSSMHHLLINTILQRFNQIWQLNHYRVMGPEVQIAYIF